MESRNALKRWGRRVLAGAALALAPAGGLHADPLPFPNSADASESDALLQRRLETALAADAALEGVRPNVVVMGGVALIGGPVATADQAERVRRVAERVPGIKRVNETCVVMGAAPAGAKPPAPLPAGLSGGPPLALRPGKRPAADAPDDAGSLPPRPGVPREAPESRPGERSTAKLTAPGSGDRRAADGFLLPPEADRTAKPAEKPTYATLPPQNVAALPVVRHRPRDPVEETRRADARYAQLDVRVQGTVATISGRAPDTDAAWDLQADLRRLRMFSDVRVGYVR